MSSNRSDYHKWKFTSCLCWVFIIRTWNNNLVILVSVFVGNLSFNTSEESLQAFFEDNGMSPISARIAYRDGASRG